MILQRQPRPGSVRVRLTGAGWGFLGLMLCGFLMSVNYSNNLIFAMTFLLIGIACLGWWQTRANLCGLGLAEWRAESVFSGQKAVYSLGLEDRAGRNHLGLEVDMTGGHGEPMHIRAGQGARLKLYRETSERGWLKPEPVRLKSCFPLGLFSAELTLERLPRVLIYTRPDGYQALPRNETDQHAHLQRESDNFADIRRYAPGDGLSRIAWQALARTGELYTKEFDGADGQSALWLAWDSVLIAGTEQRLSQLCRWVEQAHNSGREYGLNLPGERVAPALSEAHRIRCLERLALFGNPSAEGAGA